MSDETFGQARQRVEDSMNRLARAINERALIIEKVNEMMWEAYYKEKLEV